MTITQPMTPVDSSTSVTTTSATPTPPTRKPFLARIPWYAWAGAALNIVSWTMLWGLSASGTG